MPISPLPVLKNRPPPGPYSSLPLIGMCPLPPHREIITLLNFVSFLSLLFRLWPPMPLQIICYIVVCLFWTLCRWRTMLLNVFCDSLFLFILIYFEMHLCLSMRLWFIPLHYWIIFCRVSILPCILLLMDILHCCLLYLDFAKTAPVNISECV